MHFESVEMNPVDYVDGKYVLLYPLLSKYWDKSLAELPEVLKLRTINAVPLWDEIAGLYRTGRKSEQMTRRQREIKKYDMQRDPTQERETSYALVGYLRGGKSMDEFIEGQLQEQIINARSNGNDDVVTVLISKVLQPLEQICNELCDHWPKTEVLLWKAICEFKWTALYGLLANAEREKNDDLAKELKAVNTYLYRILNLDRVRVESVIGNYEIEWDNLADYEEAACDIQSEITAEGNNISRRLRVDDQKLVGNTWIATANQVAPVVQKTKHKDYATPPGKMPNVSIRRLAIKAAWEIECESKRMATANQVMDMLYSWLEDEPMLIRKIMHGIVWMTKKNTEKFFYISSCGKALQEWHKSRS